MIDRHDDLHGQASSQRPSFVPAARQVSAPAPMALSRRALALAAAGLFSISVIGGAAGAALWQSRGGAATAMPVLLPVRGAGPSVASPPAVAEVAPASALQVPIPAVGAPNYRGIVERFGPSVVGITVSGTRPVEGAESGLPPFLRGLPGLAPRGEAPFRGQGSGFVVSADGIVLTNAHVVAGASEVTVRLRDRTEHRARVLGVDAATDVAVLRIDRPGLAPVVTGDPATLRVGDYVLAIGAPFGFEQSASQGIVSAKGRALPGDSRVPFIQTDAAVNPGNSGGPLFDADGRVVGINAQIYSSSGGFQGLAFAIPIDVALRVKDQILARGRVEHARMGVVAQDLNQALADAFGFARPDGAVLAAVQPDGPAARAGLRVGDVITRIGEEPVETAAALSQRIGRAAPGERLRVQAWRDGRAQEREVQLGAVPDAGPVARAGSRG
ncbi:MAG: S1C family serine protease [Pseudomonadota bacterium]|jgi:serine protease Do